MTDCVTSTRQTETMWLAGRLIPVSDRGVSFWWVCLCSTNGTPQPFLRSLPRPSMVVFEMPHVRGAMSDLAVHGPLSGLGGVNHEGRQTLLLYAGIASVTALMEPAGRKRCPRFHVRATEPSPVWVSMRASLSSSPLGLPKIYRSHSCPPPRAYLTCPFDSRPRSLSLSLALSLSLTSPLPRTAFCWRESKCFL